MQNKSFLPILAVTIIVVGIIASPAQTIGQADKSPQEITTTEAHPQSQGQSADSPHPATGVLVAALGGFVGWILTKSVGWFLLRQRLLSYLIVVINTHLKEYHESRKWLAVVREKSIKQGHTVDMAAEYTKNELASITCVREQCFKLLRKNELVRLTNLLYRLWQIEALFDGFCKSLRVYKADAKRLNASDVNYLLMKEDRILSYLDVLPERIRTLSSLPEKYTDILGPEPIVE